MMKSLPFLLAFLFFVVTSASGETGTEGVTPAEDQNYFKLIGLELFLTADFEVLSEKTFDEDLGRMSRASDENISIEFGADLEPADWVHGSILFCWDGERSATLDEAYIFFGGGNSTPAHIGGGKITLPFGLYKTAMISDTLAQETGETLTRALVLGADWENIGFSLFGYDGDSLNKDKGNSLNSAGLNVYLAAETEEFKFMVGTGWLENLYDSDLLSEYIVTKDILLEDEVATASAYFHSAFERFAVTMEFIGGLEPPYFFEFPFSVKQKTPRAWNAEVSYFFPVGNKQIIFSTFYGETQGLQDILPEYRRGTALTFYVNEHISLGLEFIQDNDYATGNGGTGYNNELTTFLLTYEY